MPPAVQAAHVPRQCGTRKKICLNAEPALDPYPFTERSPSTGNAFVDGMHACLPIVLGYLAIGVAFGVVARTAGLSPPEVALMSLLLYAGSAQFAAAGLIGAGASVSAIVVTVFLVNIRHFLYSASLSSRVKPLPMWKSVLIGAELTDETFSVAISRPADGRAIPASWLFGLNVTAQTTWLTATTAGALVGRAIPDTRALGLDFALAAMFAALLVLQVANHPRARHAIVVAAIGAAVAVGGAQIVSASWAIICAAVIAATAGVLLEEHSPWK
jgi:4-azaleucine resistance transporter AzlC